MVSQSLIFKYPWLESAKKLLEKYPQLNFSLDELLQNKSPVISAVLPRIKSIIEDGLERKEILREYDVNDINNIILFPVLKMVLSALKDRSIIYQVANAFSKHAKELLDNERMKDGSADAEKLVTIARDLGWIVEASDTKYGNELFSFKMQFEHYLPLSVKMKDPAWKLTNQKLRGGYVFLAGKDLTRLLEEYCKQKILEAGEINDPTLKEKIRSSPVFSAFIAEVEELTKNKRVSYPIIEDYAHITQKELLFPPCVRVLYQKATQGINMVHLERLFFAFFLLNIGYSVEDVLDIYRNSPDFDDKIARYQIEHAAGQKGRGTKYRAHSCGKLKSYQLCYANDPTYGHPWCANTDPEKRKLITSPMGFVRRMAWSLKQQQERTAGIPAVGKEKDTTSPPAAEENNAEPEEP
jgi:DNA primase large subunit